MIISFCIGLFGIIGLFGEGVFRGAFIGLIIGVVLHFVGISMCVRHQAMIIHYIGPQATLKFSDFLPLPS